MAVEAQGGAAEAEVQSPTGVVCGCADNAGSVVLSPTGADGLSARTSQVHGGVMSRADAIRPAEGQ
jgi:hypothetical protein